MFESVNRKKTEETGDVVVAEEKLPELYASEKNTDSSVHTKNEEYLNAEEKLLKQLRETSEGRQLERKKENIDTVIFDFDGTLVDAEPVFFEILNFLAPEFGYGAIAQSDLAELKKMGAKDFVTRILKISFWKIPRLERRAKEEYMKRVHEVALFPEIKVVVEKLRAAGYRTGIISSSSKDLIATVLEREGVEMDFIYPSSVFGKARSIKKALKKEGLLAKDAIYIGDEMRDIEACHKNKLEIIAVSWGLNDGEALRDTGVKVVDQPEVLLEHLLIPDRGK